MSKARMSARSALWVTTALAPQSGPSRALQATSAKKAVIAIPSPLTTSLSSVQKARTVTRQRSKKLRTAKSATLASTAPRRVLTHPLACATLATSVL